MSEESQPKSPFDIEPFDFSDESKREEEIKRFKRLPDVFTKSLNNYVESLRLFGLINDQEELIEAQKKVNESISKLREMAGKRFIKKFKSIAELIKSGESGKAQPMSRYEVAFLLSVLNPNAVYFIKDDRAEREYDYTMLIEVVSGNYFDPNKEGFIYYDPRTGNVLKFSDLEEHIQAGLRENEPDLTKPASSEDSLNKIFNNLVNQHFFIECCAPEEEYDLNSEE